MLNTVPFYKIEGVLFHNIETTTDFIDTWQNHLCVPKKKVQGKHLKKDIYGSWKLTFGLKMSSFLYLQLHFRGACKSLVHQNRKSHLCHSWSWQYVFTSKAQTLSVMFDYCHEISTQDDLCSSEQGLLQTQIWMHCMFWFLSMLTWSWTWTNEDLWGLWSGSTHTWIFSLRHQQMLVVVAKYHDLEQATPRSFLSISNPMGCWTTRGERQWSLSIKLHCSKINISWVLVSLNFLVMSGLLARAQRSYTQFFWRIEVRSGKHKQNKRRAKRGKHVCKQLCFNPILVAERVPFVEYTNPGRSDLAHTFLGLLAKIKCSICSYQFNTWYEAHRASWY